MSHEVDQSSVCASQRLLLLRLLLLILLLLLLLLPLLPLLLVLLLLQVLLLILAFLLLLLLLPVLMLVLIQDCMWQAPFGSPDLFGSRGGMAQPTVGDLARLTSAKGHVEPVPNAKGELKVYVVPRRVPLHHRGASMVYSDSRTHTIASAPRGSTEAEAYVFGGAACKGLSVQTLLEEIVEEANLVLRSDSSAGASTQATLGLGKVRGEACGLLNTAQG